MSELEDVQSRIRHQESMLPSVLYKPVLFINGNQWCALYGEDLQNGVAGFGESPYLAMCNFNDNWFKKLQERGIPPTLATYKMVKEVKIKMDRLKDAYKGVNFLGEKMIRSGKTEYTEDYKQYLKMVKKQEVKH